MARTLANEIAPHNIRVNVVCPSSVKTPMMLNDWTYQLFRPDLDAPTLDDCLDAFKTLQILDIPFVDPVDISNAVLFLAVRRGPLHHRRGAAGGRRRARRPLSASR